HHRGRKRVPRGSGSGPHIPPWGGGSGSDGPARRPLGAVGRGCGRPPARFPRHRRRFASFLRPAPRGLQSAPAFHFRGRPAPQRRGQTAPAFPRLLVPMTARRREPAVNPAIKSCIGSTEMTIQGNLTSKKTKERNPSRSVRPREYPRGETPEEGCLTMLIDDKTTMGICFLSARYWIN